METPANSTTYTIETVEQITHISRDQIVQYHRWGLISTSAPAAETDLRFDDDAIHKLRRISFLASHYQVNADGLRQLAALFDEVERLRKEVRFLRAR